MDDDATLLKHYRAGSQAAFDALVARHVDWVHAAALRRLGGDAHRADDVTQAVFVALAQRGPVDRSEGAMAAWMFRVLKHVAANVVRSETRRRKHEATAAQQERAPTPDDAWTEIAPRLDAMVDQLSSRDREAILLRFYRRQTNEAVGAALGIGEEGARKRIARALDKLRAAFAKAGVTMPAVAIGEAMTTHVAPGGTTAAMLAKPTAAATSLAAAATARPIAAYALAGVAVITIATTAIIATLPARADVATTAPAASRPAIEVDEPTTRPATVSLDAALAGVKKNESAFRAIEIQFSSTLSQREPGNTEWTRTPLDMAGTATYASDGRVRIDFTTNVAEWRNGAAPTVDTPSLHTWDGVTSRSLNRQQKHSGETLTDHSGQVTLSQSPYTKPSPWMTCRTGVGYSLSFLASSTGRWPRETHALLSAQIERAISAGAPPTLAMQRLNGMETVRLHWDRPTGKRTFWLAIDRGFALVRHESPNAITPSLIDTMDVFDFAEVRPGVWFPRVATMTTTTLRPGGIRMENRYEYASSRITAADETPPAALFTIAWPAGTQLIDVRRSERRDVRIDRDGEEPPSPP